MNNTTQEPELPSKEHLFEESCLIIDEAQHEAYHAVNIALLKRNWLLGKRLNETINSGQDRAEYGKTIVRTLSQQLVVRYGNAFGERNLYHYMSFHRLYNDLFTLPDPYSQDNLNAMRSNNLYVVGMLNSLRSKFPICISWTHFRILLQVEDGEARDWYAKESSENSWSTRTLQRNVSSQYYYRLLQSHHKELVKEEMLEKSSPLVEKLEFIKSPVVAEFLGFTPNTSFTETDLESSIISNLQKFIMELGKGYAFVGRQQHIHTEKEDYYIDLVFYNYFLKCFVLMDLKTSKVTHQDVGQMDMYVRMFDELKRTDGDNPTIGILLCSDTDEDIARYSILHDSKQLFATKYKLYLPTQEELKAEIEAQKAQYYLQFKGQNKS